MSNDIRSIRKRVKKRLKSEIELLGCLCKPNEIVGKLLEIMEQYYREYVVKFDTRTRRLAVRYLMSFFAYAKELKMLDDIYQWGMKEFGPYDLDIPGRMIVYLEMKALQTLARSGITEPAIDWVINYRKLLLEEIDLPEDYWNSYEVEQLFRMEFHGALFDILGVKFVSVDCEGFYFADLTFYIWLSVYTKRGFHSVYKTSRRIDREIDGVGMSGWLENSITYVSFRQEQKEVILGFRDMACKIADVSLIKCNCTVDEACAMLENVVKAA